MVETKLKSTATEILLGEKKKSLFGDSFQTTTDTRKDKFSLGKFLLEFGRWAHPPSYFYKL